MMHPEALFLVIPLAIVCGILFRAIVRIVLAEERTEDNANDD